ncbi:ATP-binding cassette domain-containing protein [Telluribacter sp. SYSU D00476]|uniref:ABC transporter ATP-binding protein n=1 Tax=Telluribacter sp. SYSU D00476 TaxID=2811430 RepID=UPI001FF2D007|nr:ATP-binding cassette domain-containing protein [Telluribacter sp. SYSU D00476]
MQIIAKEAGKKFVTEWIVRRVNLDLHTGQSYTFVGPNGSGKSTLIQLLTGSVPVTEGTVTYRMDDGKELDIDNWYKHIVLAAPYLEVIEEFTLRELVEFHRKFKPFKNGLSAADFEDFVQLSHTRHKVIRHFSSGMKQRVRLGLAFQSDVPVVFLDEPTSNLDAQGVQWYLDNVINLTDQQLVVIGSNQPQEYEFCKNIISVSGFKQK